MLHLFGLAQTLLVVGNVVQDLLGVLGDRKDGAGTVKDLGDLFEHKPLGLGVVEVDHDDGEDQDGNVHGVVLPREGV